MYTKIKFMAIAFCLLMLPAMVFAQSTKKKTENEKSITIRKKGGAKEKFTIVVDGDKVTVNGKPVDDMKDIDVKVDDMAPEDFNFNEHFFNLKVHHPTMLGVYSQPNEKGAELTEVNENSAAEKAGLKKGDIITSVGGKKIDEENDLAEAIQSFKPKQEVEIVYLREGKELKTKAILDRRRSNVIINGNRMPQMYNYNNNQAMLGVYSDAVEKGAELTEVSKESAAEKAGLKKGDIITSVGGKKIDEENKLGEVIQSFKPKQEVEIVYLREGKEMKTKAKLDKRESINITGNFEMPYNQNFNWDGLQGLERLQELRMPPDFRNSEPFRASIGNKIGIKIQDLEEGSGVKVLEVDDESPAAKAGIKEGDILTEVDGTKIETADDARNELIKAKTKKAFTLKASRNGTVVNFEIKFPKKLKTVDL